MDHVNHDAFCQSIHVPNPSATAFHQSPPVPVRLHPDSRPEAELKDGATTTRKVQKADREKLRRDRLNDQFLELGKVLDPDRPKHDKASILTDTIQIVKDLTAQVNRLKAEYASLTEESRELTQEKNDLREEKASLKSDIENLNAQYQRRLRATFPWATMDHSVMMHPPSYPMPMPMPMPVPIPPGPIPMHPSLQPYPFFGNQNHGVIPNPCSTFVPYVTPMIDQQSTQYMSPSMQPGSSKQDSRNKASDRQGESKIGKSEASNDVATDLELKTPGSTADEDSSFGRRKSKKLPRKESSLTDGSSSRCSSSPSIQDSSSNSVVDGGKADD